MALRLIVVGSGFAAWALLRLDSSVAAPPAGVIWGLSLVSFWFAGCVDQTQEHRQGSLPLWIRLLIWAPLQSLPSFGFEVVLIKVFSAILVLGTVLYSLMVDLDTFFAISVSAAWGIGVLLTEWYFGRSFTPRGGE